MLNCQHQYPPPPLNPVNQDDVTSTEEVIAHIQYEYDIKKRKFEWGCEIPDDDVVSVAVKAKQVIIMNIL
jgi:hypothetical protein